MEFLMLFLLGVAGILLHVVAQFRNGITLVPKNGQSFTDRFMIVWNKFDLLGNAAYGLFAIVVVLVLVGVRESIVDLLPVTPMSIFFYGYFADSAFKNLKPEQLS